MIMKHAGPIVAAALAVSLLAGCGRPKTIVTGLTGALEQAAEKTGARIAGDFPGGGRVLFLHAELSVPLADAMRKGLRSGLGEHLQLDEMGPGQLPPNFPMLPGSETLNFAIKRYSNDVAVVTALGITDDNASRVPADIPPLYILNWQNPDWYRAILRHPKCRGGEFYSLGASGPVFQEVPATH